MFRASRALNVLGFSGLVAAVLLIVFASCQPSKSGTTIIFSASPIPCVTTSAGNPYNPTNPTATCQPTWNPGASPTQKPTPGPITFTPPSIAFPGPTATATSVTIVDPNFSGSFTVSPTPAGFASASVSGFTITLAPLSIGTGAISVTDGNSTALLPVVTATTPPPGPITFSPSSVHFTGPTASPTTVAITDPNYGGSFTVSPTPVGVVSASVTGHTISLTPESVGNGAVAVSDGTNNVTFTADVNPTPTPGAITLSPNSITFVSPTSSPTTVAISQFNYVGPFTAGNATPVGIASAAISQTQANTLNVSPIYPGTAGVLVTGANSQTTSLPIIVNTPPPFNTVLCVNGSGYAYANDMEFTGTPIPVANGADINAYSPSPVPLPGTTGYYQLYSTIPNLGPAPNDRFNNAYSDDAWYPDPSVNAGGLTYQPYYQPGGGLPLTITANAVPSPWATATSLSPSWGPTPTSTPSDQRHWLSGVLSMPAVTYGYFEISAQEPNLQGFWPAPLWLLGSNHGGPYTPPGVQEIDLNEIFGNCCGTSNVYQTIHYFYPGASPSPIASPYSGSYDVNNVVTPNPQTYYHTYGVLWLPPPSAQPTAPGSVQFYIDRQPTSSAYPALLKYPLSPIIQLQVFTQNTYAPGPANNTPQVMNLAYYRQFTANGGGCGTAPTLATPVPIVPSPSPAATAVAIATMGPVAVATGYGNTNLTTGGTPTVGHMLLAFIQANANAIQPPTSTWTTLPSVGNNFYFAYSCVVVSGTPVAGGPGQCNAATSYNFTGNGSLGVLMEISGENTTVAPQTSFAYAYGPPLNLPFNITNSGALNLNVWGVNAQTTTGPTTPSYTLPTGQTQSLIVNALNTAVGTEAETLLVQQITTEAFQGGFPYTSQINFATNPSNATYGGQFVQILPSGVTPGPAPYPSPSYPAQIASPTPMPNSNPTVAPTATPVLGPTPYPPLNFTPTPLPPTYYDGTYQGVISTPLPSPPPWTQCAAAGKPRTHLDSFGENTLQSVLGTPALEASFNNQCVTVNQYPGGFAYFVAQSWLPAAPTIYKYSDAHAFESDLAAGLVPSGIGIMYDNEHWAATPGCIALISTDMAACTNDQGQGGPITPPNFENNQQYNFGYWYCRVAAKAHANGDWMIATPAFDLMGGAGLLGKYPTMLVSPNLPYVEQCTDEMELQLQQIEYNTNGSGSTYYGQFLGQIANQYNSVPGTNGKWMVGLGVGVKTAFNGEVCIVVPVANAEANRDLALKWGADGDWDNIQGGGGTPNCPNPTPTPSTLLASIGTYGQYDQGASVPTPFPSPTSIPTPIYYDQYPGQTYPVSVPSLPITTQMTVTAEINCLSSQSTGAGILGAAGTFDLGAGLCAATTNPTTGIGAHFFADNGTPNTQAGPTNGLAVGQYLVAGSIDGANINWYACALPYTLNDCAKVSASDTATFTAGNVAGYIGSAQDGSSRNATGLLDIWNVTEYSSALSTAQLNQLALIAQSDPYPVATAPPTATPTPAAYIAQPYNGSLDPGPYATTLPTPGSFTVLVQIKCNTQQGGSGIGALGYTGSTSAVSLEAGPCPIAPTPNPTGQYGAGVFFPIAGAAGAQPATAPVAGQYTIAATNNGTTAAYIVCTYPAPPTCSQVTGAGASSLGITTNNALIGADGTSLVRAFNGDIWNFQLYNFALSYTSIQNIAGNTTWQYGVVPDPYPSGGTPAPVYTSQAPGNAYPYAVTLPTPPAYTIFSEIKCNTTLSGSTILTQVGVWSLEAGVCNGVSNTNPTDGTGTHFYIDPPVNAQSLPSNSLAANPQIYIIAATNTGTSATYYACTYPSISCSAATPITFTSNPTPSTSGILGGSSIGSNCANSIRCFQGDIWNVAIYPAAFTQAQITSWATTNGVADPYPSPGAGPLNLTPTSLTFGGPTSQPQAATISDPNYAGTFSASSNNAPVATATTSGNGPNGGTVTVSPVGVGNATITVSDTVGNMNTLAVTVSNGSIAYPNAGWVPFPSGPLTQTVAIAYGGSPLTSCPFTYTAPSGYPYQVSGTCLLSTSNSIISANWGQYGDSPGPLYQFIGGSSAYQNAYANPTHYGETGAYFQSSGSDQAYTASDAQCIYDPGSNTFCFPGTIHIPAGAVPETGYDHHMFVRDSTNGDWGMWRSFQPCSGSFDQNCTLQGGTGSTVYLGTGGLTFGSDMINEGLNIPATAGKMASIWSIRAQDVLAGRIPHAIIFYTGCDTNYDGGTGPGDASYVYPVVPFDGAAGDGSFYCQNNQYNYVSGSTNNQNFTYGNHLWLDVAPSPSQRNTPGCDILSYAVLRDLNEFGAYMNDVITNRGQPAFFAYAPDINDTYSSNPNGTHSYWTDVLNSVDANAGSSGPGNSGYIAGWPMQSCGISMTGHLHVLIPPRGS